MLTIHAWIAIGITATVFAGLQMRRRLPVDLMFMGSLVAVTVTGVITPSQALKNFQNPAVITIAALLVVSSGLRATGVLDWLGEILLGKVQSEKHAMQRMSIALVAASAFVLNTALVAMTVPVIVDWCRRRSISPSRLLIPVSYFVILGGVCSLIGTSTTLIVNGLLREQAVTAAAVMANNGEMSPDTSHPNVQNERRKFQENPSRYRKFAKLSEPLSLFEIGRSGVPCAIAGSIVLLLAGARLLPNRSDLVDKFDKHRREYLTELRVMPECKLIGQTVEAAGLTSLPGSVLVEIARAGEVVSPVGSEVRLEANDHLVFSGIINTIVGLEKIVGLAQVHEATELSRPGGHLVEAVVSRTSPLIGLAMGDGEIRRLYQAEVIAVHRTGVRLTSKINEIRTEVGDTLLLRTDAQFVHKFRNSRDFYLVSAVDGYSPLRHGRSGWAITLGIALISLLILGTLPIVQAACPPMADPAAPAVIAIAIACLMIVTRCMSVSLARSSLDMQVLLAIVGALGLGEALWSSGAAVGIAKVLVGLVGNNPYLLFVVIYLMAMSFTELITNNAVATILLPLAIGVAWESGCSPRPFIVAVSMAASLSFLTPVGYQTNLMVMGPGGYVARDYLRIGAPVAAAVTLTALTLIPRIWPFFP